MITQHDLVVKAARQGAMAAAFDFAMMLVDRGMDSVRVYARTQGAFGLTDDETSEVLRLVYGP